MSIAHTGFKRKPTASSSSRFPESKRLHVLNTNLSSNISQRAYYSSSSDNEDDLCDMNSEAVNHRRRFSLPAKRRNCAVTKNLVRRNSKLSADTLDSLNNKKNISKIINAANSVANVIDDSKKTLSQISDLSSPLPNSDLQARARCFDYLMGAIDEAWARYCQTTSCAEEKIYSGMSGSNDFPSTPISAVNSDYDSDYKTDVTDLTDYDSEYYECSIKKKVSQQPESIKIQNFKDRLIKAKKYLEDLVDSNNTDDSIAFWARWDIIKYSTIEIFEDDDDDDLIEDTIEDLERGRCF